VASSHLKKRVSCSLLIELIYLHCCDAVGSAIARAVKTHAVTIPRNSITSEKLPG